MKRRAFIHTLGAAGLGMCAAQSSRADQIEQHLGRSIDIPIIKGESREVIPAHPDKPGEKGWFTNDHCFVEDRQGRLHWIGINNPLPPEGKELYRYHPYLGHLSTDDPMGKWDRHPWALDESQGTEYLGAPAIVWVPEQNRYVMVVETWLDQRRLEVCYSEDLTTWERTREPILPDKLWISTRDPQILRQDDGTYWVLLTSFGAKDRKQSQIIRLRTRDFETFEGPDVILGIDDCQWATLMESPFLWQRDGLWYLFFSYAHRHYAETPVVVSDNPDHFDFNKQCVTTLFGHAAEIFTYKQKTYISSCGPEDSSVLNRHGVTLAELGWAKIVG